MQLFVLRQPCKLLMKENVCHSNKHNKCTFFFEVKDFFLIVCFTTPLYSEIELNVFDNQQFAVVNLYFLGLLL